MTAAGSARDLIDGRFELLERLGGGGMGMVWRARDTMLQREVALKEVRPAMQAAYDDDPIAAHVMRERVLREARALARLHHPNVVTIYHIVDSVEQRHPWLVMELVTGGSLGDRIKRAPLQPQEAAHIGRGVLAALRAAHDAGIQHRDVKPANVLLRPDGTPVLTDFGIAALRESSSLTTTGALIGSPEYIAPERIRGQEGDPASDLWSLGMLMYVALEGHNPLRRETNLATLAAVLDAPIPEPAHAGPLAPVLAALLARDPAARPDAARLDHLLSVAEQGAITAMYDSHPGSGGYGDGSLGNHASYGSQVGHGSSVGGYGHPAASYVSPFQSSIPPFGPSGAAYGPADSSAHGYASNGAGHVSDSTGGSDGFSHGSGSTYAADFVGGPVSAQGQSRRRRKATFVASITGTAVIGLAAALVWTLHDSPASALTGDRPGAGVSSATTSPLAGFGGASSAPSAPSGGGTGADGGQSVNLLTPAGARAFVSALNQQFGGRKVVELVLYPSYAAVELETAADQTLYDEYWYRGGAFQVESHGQLTDQQRPVDLGAIDWNLLPKLIANADQTLKVPKPTSTYVILDGNFLDSGPGIAIYVADAYGSAYLLADLKGDVVRRYPRGS